MIFAAGKAGNRDEDTGAKRLIDLKEVLVANGLTVLLMWYLLDCRRKNRESTHVQDRIYDGMCVVNLAGALFETISFLVDGTDVFGGRQISYLTNSLCFLGTVSIGFLWSLYVDLRIYGNYKRTSRRVAALCIPWLVEVVVIFINLFGVGFLFTVSADNLYARGPGVVIGYVSLMIYFAYSVILTIRSREDANNLHFFPVLYFVGPCIAGVLIQFFCYGITTSWISVAVAMIFVQMQSYAEKTYLDELSGLFNRRFFDRMLEKRGKAVEGKGSLFGIMLDINDFKAINDSFGHNVGDRAIRVMGEVLFRSIPDGARAIRFAGDEFIVLLPGTDEQQVLLAMDEIRAALAQINEAKVEPFSLHAAMGYAKLGPGDDAEVFLRRMDEKMYEEKRAFHGELAK